jgi:hypothetical protein
VPELVFDVVVSMWMITPPPPHTISSFSAGTPKSFFSVLGCEAVRAAFVFFFMVSKLRLAEVTFKEIL